MSIKFKQAGIAFIMTIMVIPFLQEFLGVFKPMELKGITEKADEPFFNLTNWFNSSFQTAYEKYVEENIGFRPAFIRIYNQVNFTLFNTSESPGVVIGKENYLYLKSYTDSYNGKNYIGNAKVEWNVLCLKLLQEKLKEKNKDLIVVLAPGKATYYNEFIPDAIAKPIQISNFNAYKNAFYKSGINMIDMNTWFKSMKASAQIKLYPKYGVHWSYYGSFLASDSLSRFIEKLHNCNLPYASISEITYSDSLRNPDYDIGELLNIYTELKDTMPYPTIKYTGDASTSKPSCLIISDSYTWHWYEQKYLDSTFNKWSFWFYNNTMYPESFSVSTKTDQINYMESLLKYDLIILMATEATLDLFPYKITERTEPFYLPKDRAQLVMYFEKKIRADKDWLDKIKLNAEQESKNLDAVITGNAEWMADELMRKSN